MYTMFNHWYSSLKVIFLTELENNQAQVDKYILAKIDNDLSITNTLDPELKRVWYPLSIRLGYETAVQPAHKFISSVGRAKYLTPIYKAMIDAGRKDEAIGWFNENKGFYHPYCVGTIGKLLGLSHPHVEAAFNHPVTKHMLKKYDALKAHGITLPYGEEEAETLFVQQ